MSGNPNPGALVTVIDGADFNQQEYPIGEYLFAQMTREDALIYKPATLQSGEIVSGAHLTPASTNANTFSPNSNNGSYLDVSRKGVPGNWKVLGEINRLTNTEITHHFALFKRVS